MRSALFLGAPSRVVSTAMGDTALNRQYFGTEKGRVFVFEDGSLRSALFLEKESPPLFARPDGCMKLLRAFTGNSKDRAAKNASPVFH